MYLASTAQIKQLDKIACERFSFTEESLMDNAAKALSEEIKNTFGANREYVFFCGRGKNAGDGFLTARNLKLSGAKVRILLTDSEDKLSPAAFQALEKAKKAIVPIGDISEGVSEKAIIVDALLGISVSGAPEGSIKQAIDIINKCPNTKISIDVPSGLNADSGRFAGSVVKADHTYTLAIDKTGLNIYPGIEYCGEKKLLDIGIPEQAVAALQFRTYLSDGETVRAMLPERKPDGHKGDFGKVGKIGGSEGMAGSVCLAAEAVLTSGAGMCYVFVPSEIKNTVAAKLTEAIVVDDSRVLEYFDVLDSIAVGMGHAQNSKAKHIIKTVMQKYTKPVVVDGDGLNQLSANISLLKSKKCPVVLTPHTVEFSRLIGISAEEINKSRIYLTEKFSAEFNVSLVLKGARSVICKQGGAVRINPTGNSGMATAGSGDVLSGIIAALLAQGADTYEAAVTGVYLHGMAGDFAAAEKTEYSVKAGDIISYLPEAFKKITK